MLEDVQAMRDRALEAAYDAWMVLCDTERFWECLNFATACDVFRGQLQEMVN